jgi:2,4-dienoyl-CoA reductase-like NADH-dependent reductase (Old Yellow Enzyme family)
MRLLLQIAERLCGLMPEELPLFVRISATDWVEGGWDIEQSVELARQLKGVGVDLIDLSSGGTVPYARIPVEKGYQVPFARRIREEVDIRTGRRSRLEKQPTDLRRKTCYFGDRTLDFRYDGDTMDTVAHVVEVFGRFPCMP